MKCENEYALIIKTNESKIQDIEDMIHENHSYSTPIVADRRKADKPRL